ncbi:MAG: TRAP transporter fused permease subunit [Chloroflexota bacterium]
MAEDTVGLASKYREPRGKVWAIITILFPTLALVLAVLYTFQIPQALTGVLPEVGYLWILVMAFLPLVFYWIPMHKNAPRDRIPWYDIILFVLTFIIPIYFIYKIWPIYREGWGVVAPATGRVLGLIVWLLVMEAARRSVGLVFAIFLVVLSTFPLYSSILPGVLSSSNSAFFRLVSNHVFGWDGIMGIPMTVYGRLFLGYMVFALVIQQVGAGDFFRDAALAILGKTRGGNAKVSIVSSGLFGSVSGASVANVFVTGSFTIPAMKKEGFPPHFAAGVEACASAGGPLMPPIMGSVAFIMSEFLAVPYASVALVAVIPSILYYFVLFVQIDAYAARLGLKPPPSMGARPKVGKILTDHIHILLGFVVLVYILFGLRLEQWAPWLASAVTIVLAMPRKRTRINLQSYVSLVKNIGRVLGDLIAIFTGVGLIISAFTLAGIAYSLPHIIVSIAGGNLLFLLAMGAVASFILGMGVPVSAVYIFLAIVLAPGLVEGGIDVMAAHFFVLYTAMWSAITPPVAITAFAAAGLADADAMKTGFQAMRLGIAKYLLPFFFVFSPALILRGGTLPETIQAIATCALGLAVISAALEGYMWRIGILKPPMRILFFASGLLLAMPGTSTDIIGAALTVLFLISGFLLRKLVTVQQ